MSLCFSKINLINNSTQLNELLLFFKIILLSKTKFELSEFNSFLMDFIEFCSKMQLFELGLDSIS